VGEGADAGRDRGRGARRSIARRSTGVQGLSVRPYSALSVKNRALNGGTLVRPMMIAPALRSSHRRAVDLRDAILERHHTLVVARPA